jgi:hypothetical protein
MRVADGDGAAVVTGVLYREVELDADGSRIFCVIQEDIPRRRGHSGVNRGVVSDRGGSGAAIDEEEMATRQQGHQFSHESRVGGTARTFVIIYTRGVRHGQEHVGDRPLYLGGPHSRA